MKIIHKNEGGYVNDPSDRGGETNFGIADNADGVTDGMTDIDFDGKPDVKIKDLTIEQATEIYKEKYYKPLNIGCIVNELLALHVFDFGVNSGITNAAKTLQRLMNDLTSKNPLSIDGKIGPKTILAVNTFKDQKHLAELYMIERKEYYETISKKGQNAKFLSGWLKRIDNTTKYLG